MKIQELLTELRVPFRQHGEAKHVTEGWLGLVCPYCDAGAGNFGLGYNLASGALSCWKCGPHKLNEVLAAITGQDRRDVAKLTGVVERFRAPRTWGAEPRGMLVLPAGVEELGPAHRRYLERRGFDPDELVAVWKIQGIGVAAKLAWRIFIPVHRDWEVVSWTTRAIGDVPHADRYRGARREQSIYPRRSVLYGADLARHGVVVCEGPFDVWAIGPGAVCTAGTGFSRGQVAQLAKFPIRAIAFDNDTAAQRRARALADELSVFPGATYCVRLDAKDAATADRAELAELRRRFLD